MLERFLSVPWNARRSNQSILKEISPEYSLEGLMLKLKLQYFGHLMWRTDSLEKTLMLGKIEDRKRRGRERMRWLNGIIDSMDMSLSKLRELVIGKPVVLQSMGSQRVGHDWPTELNCANRNANYCEKELKTVRKSQEKLENSFAETKAELKAIHNRMNDAEERISDLEERKMEIIWSKQPTAQKKRRKQAIWDLWNNIKYANLHTTGIPKGEEREKRIENVLEETMAKNFPNLKVETDIQIQETHRVLNKMNPNRPTPRYIIFKMAKVQDSILKAAREKQRVNDKGTPIRLSADFHTEMLQPRRKWQNIFKVSKGKLQPRILYPVR